MIPNSVIVRMDYKKQNMITNNEENYSNIVKGKNFYNVHNKTTVKKISTFLFKSSLYLNNYDPLRIYKLEDKFYSKARYKIFGTRRRNFDKKDILQMRISKLLCIYSTYYIIKSILAGIIQYYLKSVRSRNQYEKSKEYIMFVRRFSLFMGNPLSELSEISIFMYFCAGFSTYIFFIGLPYYYSKHPLNITILRFMFDPADEIEMCDILIEARLKELMNSIDFYKLQQIKLYTRNKSFNNNSRYDFDKIWIHLEANRGQMISYLDKKSILRPDSYTSRWYIQLYNLLPKILLVPYITNTIWFIIGLPYVIQISIEGKCKIQNILMESCSPFLVFSLQDFIFTIELCFMMLICLLTFTLHLSLFMLMATNQLSIIKSIRHELKACLNKLIEVNNQKDYNCFRDSKFGDHNRKNSTICLDVCPTIDYSKDEKQQSEIENLILKTFVKVFVCLGDLKRGSTNLSELMGAFILNVTSLTIALLITEGMGANDEHRIFLQFNLITNWLIINSLCIACAHVFSCYLSIERIYWSIMSQLLIIYNKRFNDSPGGDLFFKLWHKLVICSNTIKFQYCVHPFSIDLTYQKTLELNFVIISLYALSKAS